MHLKPSLTVVFSNTVILAGSSVDAVTDSQDGCEQGADELVTHSDGQLNRLRGERGPCEEAAAWRREHKNENR